MRIISSSMHRIDIDANSHELIPINRPETDLVSYLTDLLAEITQRESKRKFKHRRSTTEFASSLISTFRMANESCLSAENFAINLAKRLLEKEVESDEQMTARLGTRSHLKRGSFLQFIFNDEGDIKYLCIKVEHTSFLDETEFTIRVGMPLADKSYKACKVSFTHDGSLGDDVLVYDTNSTIAVYWWREFLELEERIGDELNTNRASQAVVGQIAAHLKSKFQRDHTLLRNSVLTRFRQHGGLNYNDLIQEIFVDYEPENREAKEIIENLIVKLKELPEKKNFDTQFNSIPSSVPFRRRKISLDHDIDLSYDEGVNINDRIWSSQLSDGRKVIIIESESGYNSFPEKPID